MPEEDHQKQRESAKHATEMHSKLTESQRDSEGKRYQGSSTFNIVDNSGNDTDVTPPLEPTEKSDEPAEDEPENSEGSIEHTEAAETQPSSLLHKQPEGKWRRFWYWFATHKKLSIPLTILLLLAIVGAIPKSRYAALGLFWHQGYTVSISDSQTRQPISGAWISMAGLTRQTDNHGHATLHTKAGPHSLTISKKYYKTQNYHVSVPIRTKKANVKGLTLQATGRAVPVMVENRITGKPIENALIAAADTDIKTDNKGMATIVLPADKATVSAQLSATGYNSSSATLHVTTSVDKANTFQLTPAGKLYFLSNLSGKIDVAKTNLDGSDRQIVLAGTGTEDKGDTVLLASQDWKYLALFSKRAGGDHAKLFLINTAGDSITTMDEGNADFTPIGWSGHYFIYKVYRAGYQYWQPNFEAVKSYDADTGKIASLDQNTAAGNANAYFYEDYSSVNILNNEIVYAKRLISNSGFQGDQYAASINSIKPDGSNKHALKKWTNASNISVWSGSIYATVVPYGPNGIYAASTSAYMDQDHLYEYEDGQFKTVDGKKAQDIYIFQEQYATYLSSPSNKQTFWSEARDGKQSLFVGDADGGNGKQIASLSDYTSFGWYTDNYLLVSKNSSELYIMPTAGGTATKITDYYKPNFNSAGYGKGYGGF